MAPPGGIVSREYKGEEIKVKVLGRGFEYNGEVYRSLSGVAKAKAEAYCEVIVKRWEEFTGRKAERLAEGRPETLEERESDGR